MPFSLRKYIGYVPQEPIIPSMDVKMNVQFGNVEAKKEEVIKAAKVANAHDYILQ